MFKKILVAMVALILVLVFVTNAKADERNAAIQACANSAMWKSIGVGAAYGGGVMLVASGLVAATSTVAVPVGTVAVVVVGETAVGALLGGGAAAASMAYQEGTLFKHSPLIAACTKEIDAAQASGIAKLRAKASAVYQRL